METTRNKRRTLSSLTMRKWWPCVRWRCPFFFRSRDLSLSFPSSPGCVRAHLILFSFLSFFQSPITIDTISFRGSGPLIDGQRSRNFRPRWPSFECDLPACPTCRHARWAPGASSAPRPRRCRPCKSTSPGWPLVQGCGEQRLDRLCPLTHQLELSKEKKRKLWKWNEIRGWNFNLGKTYRVLLGPADGHLRRKDLWRILLWAARAFHTAWTSRPLNPRESI